MAKDEPRSVAQNRKARHDYFIEDTLEVKSVLLSVGPDRKQTLEIRNPFERT